MIFCRFLSLKLLLYIFFIPFYFSIKLFFHKDLSFILFYVLSFFIAVFGLSSACFKVLSSFYYDV